MVSAAGSGAGGATVGFARAGIAMADGALAALGAATGLLLTNMYNANDATAPIATDPAKPAMRGSHKSVQRGSRARDSLTDWAGVIFFTARCCAGEINGDLVCDLTATSRERVPATRSSR